MRAHRSATVVAILAVVLALTVSGCTAPRLTSLPVPGRDVMSGYSVTFEFATVLNLPERAKVVLDGTSVGTVGSVDLLSDRVLVHSRIANDTKLPDTIHASLQQDTVLGDIYVALQRPPTAPGMPLLADGATVPLERTTSPPQLEDTLAVLATFFASGSIQRVQQTVNRLNATMPNAPRVRRMTQQVVADLGDLSTDLDGVDTWLSGVAGTVGVVHQNQDLLASYLTPGGQQNWDRATTMTTYISTILPSIGSIYEGGFWLVPLFNSLADAAGAVRTSFDGIENAAELNRVLGKMTQWAAHPKVDVVGVETSGGTNASEDVRTVLKMLGALP